MKLHAKLHDAGIAIRSDTGKESGCCYFFDEKQTHVCLVR